jgi:hypothetical protein
VTQAESGRVVVPATWTLKGALIPIVGPDQGFPSGPRSARPGARRLIPCWLMDPCCDPEVRHEGRCRPTMFRKQVSRPVDSLGPP